MTKKLWLVAGLRPSGHQQQAGQGCSGILVSSWTDDELAQHQANGAKQGANDIYLCIDTPQDREQCRFIPAINWIKTNKARLEEHDRRKTL